MSEYILIRHGQASFGKANYDQLSALGKKQAFVLGEYLNTAVLDVHKVYIGGLQRHRETATEIQIAFEKAGRVLPEFIVDRNLDEHHGPQVVKKYFDQLKLEDSAEAEYARNFDARDPLQMKEYFKMFNRITLQWAEGKIEDPEIQSWTAFRTQTKLALQKIMEEDLGGERILVVTSGGPVASLCGESLGITEGKIMGLAQEIYNASYSKILRNGNKLSLKVFNKHVYTDKSLITLV